MARYWIETKDGRKRKTIYGKKRKDVADELSKVLSNQANGIFYNDENVTVGEYLDKGLNGSVRKSTFDCYEVICRRHIVPALGGMKLSRLTPVHVQEFYRDKLDGGLASASVHKCHTVLHKALDQAVNWHLIPRNVCDGVKAPRAVPKEEMRTLSPEETRHFLEAARGDRLEALYVLAVTTGMRQGELLGLKWQDVDLEAKMLQVRRTLTRHGGKIALGEPKTKKSRRSIRLTSHAVEVLKAHLNRQLREIEILGDRYQDQGLIFTTDTGAPVNPSNLRQRSFAPLLKRAGLPHMRFHDLRHTCATLLLSRGVHPKFVQELLGHATIAITLDTYSHVMPSMGDATARAMEDALIS
jgi:integrase